MERLQAEVNVKDTQLQRQGTELQERATQINRQQRELQTLIVWNIIERYSNACIYNSV